MVSTKEVILLNADYSYLNTIDWKKAMCLLSKCKTEVVKYSDRVIKTTTETIKIPLVMRLIKIIRTLFKNRVPFSKKNVIIRDGFVCMYCGKSENKLTIDHVIPKSKGGKSTFENCVASCKPCNNEKGDKSCVETGMFPRKRPTQPTISEFLRIRMIKSGIDEIIADCFK